MKNTLLALSILALASTSFAAAAPAVKKKSAKRIPLAKTVARIVAQGHDYQVMPDVAAGLGLDTSLMTNGIFVTKAMRITDDEAPDHKDHEVSVVVTKTEKGFEPRAIVIQAGTEQMRDDGKYIDFTILHLSIDGTAKSALHVSGKAKQTNHEKSPIDSPEIQSRVKSEIDLIQTPATNKLLSAE